MTLPRPPLQPAPGDPADPLHACLRTALEAADAAASLGLAPDRLRAAHADAIQRIGFPGPAYVLAMIGGTGVGKSSLLNALAGSTVSAASVRRPTTSEPVAWIPTAERDGLLPLLDWLGVTEIREHTGTVDGVVAILDLPDVDSLQTSHRDRVEALLPRLDAVAWVADPEKYHDAVLHDAFLRAWLPRLARQAVVVNKADRVAGADADRIRQALETDLGGAAPVLLTRARPDDVDIDALRGWLAAGVSGKAIVRARIAATMATEVRALARAAGVDPGGAGKPFVDDRARATAVRDATAVILRAVDLPGIERQAIAATRAAARARGTGPIGTVTSLVHRLSGRAARTADPTGYLVRWQERATLGPAVEAIRAASSDAIRTATPAVRGTLAASLEPVGLRRGLERAVDRVTADVGELRAPTSRWWTAIGALQSLTTAGIVLSVAWTIIWVLGGPGTSMVDLPLLGLVPTPFATLVGLLVVGYLLARLLGVHAGWTGRRWAARLRARIASSVEAEIRQRGLAPLDELEGARGRLWAATREMERACGRPGTPGVGHQARS